MSVHNTPPALTWYSVHAGSFEAQIVLKWSESAGGFLHREMYALDVVLIK